MFNHRSKSDAYLESHHLEPVPDKENTSLNSYEIHSDIGSLEQKVKQLEMAHNQLLQEHATVKSQVNMLLEWQKKSSNALPPKPIPYSAEEEKKRSHSLGYNPVEIFDPQNYSENSSKARNTTIKDFLQDFINKQGLGLAAQQFSSTSIDPNHLLMVSTVLKFQAAIVKEDGCSQYNVPSFEMMRVYLNEGQKEFRAAMFHITNGEEGAQQFDICAILNEEANINREELNPNQNQDFLSFMHKKDLEVSELLDYLSNPDVKETLGIVTPGLFTICKVSTKTSQNEIDEGSIFEFNCHFYGVLKPKIGEPEVILENPTRIEIFNNFNSAEISSCKVNGADERIVSYRINGQLLAFRLLNVSEQDFNKAVSYLKDIDNEKKLEMTVEIIRKINGFILGVIRPIRDNTYTFEKLAEISDVSDYFKA
jgi:hypothetical protein